MTDYSSIEVREAWKKYYLICFFAFVFIFSFAFIIPGQRKESIDFVFGKWNFAKLPFFLLFAFVPSLCLFYYFDKRVKVRVNSDGIWSRRKGNITWSDIWYFSSTACKMRSDGDIHKLHVRLKDTEDRLDAEETFKFRRVDKSFDEIRSVVEYYAGKYNIEDLGHENEV